MIWQVSIMSAHESQETNYDLVEEEKITNVHFNISTRVPSVSPLTQSANPPLIDSATFDETTDRTTDGIATFLFKWKPEALDSFLDIKFTRKLEFYRREAPTSSMYDMFIGRLGKVVMVIVLRRLV